MFFSQTYRQFHLTLSVSFMFCMTKGGLNEAPSRVGKRTEIYVQLKK